MSNLGATTVLHGNLQAAMAEMLEGVMQERGRGFASDREAWAELKERLENIAAATKNIEKVHKEMWDAVKDHNGDAFCALAQEFERAAAMIALEWAAGAVMAKIAVEFVEGQ